MDTPNESVIDLSQARSVDTNGEAFKVSVGQGGFDSTVSSQWFSRPDDQKFLDLNSLYDYTKGHADNSFHSVINVSDIRVEAPTDNPDDLRLQIPGKHSGSSDIEAIPNHWSFGQLATLGKAPAGYLRKLPAQIAGINLQYSLANLREESVKAYVTRDGDNELRAATGAGYGRVHDYEVVRAVQKIAGNGIGDTNWKVPGVLNWQDGTYDPNAPITRESTTLFASDRDLFLFLVDDKHPIEIGKLPNGEPDLIFRGFYVWNSEVGNRSLGIATFYLRGVCQNRCIWGVEGYTQTTIRHSSGAPARFAQEAAPALAQFSNQSTNALIEGVKAAKSAKVAHNDDSADEFLKGRGFSKAKSKQVIESVIKEEGHKPRSVWDFVQGITAVAREEGHQDARINLERAAGKLLDKVA